MLSPSPYPIVNFIHVLKPAECPTDNTVNIGLRHEKADPLVIVVPVEPGGQIVIGFAWTTPPWPHAIYVTKEV